MRFLPVNLNMLLVELADLPQTLALLDALQAQPIAGVLELVPAARTILITFRPSIISREKLTERIAAIDVSVGVERHGDLVEIPVRYDGEDLDEVAAHLGITREEVIRRHTQSVYTVAFTGFAPGFAYLSGGDPVFDVPRRKTPRTRIPAGAVALAGTFSAVYPKASPGGWQIIGITDAPMWDLSRAVPALLQPGMRVRFVNVADAADVAKVANVAHMAKKADEPSSALAVEESADHAALIVRQPGLQAVFQDLGRLGQAGQGVSASGAMDQGALRAANRLVGNVANAPCIELAYGGFEAECRGDAVVAVTGADVPLTLTNREGKSWPVPSHQPLALTDGDRLRVGQPQAGIRAYVAVRGGFGIEPVLGSYATDTLAEVGPAPLKAGDVLRISDSEKTGPGPVVGSPEEPVADLPRADGVVTLDVVMGPRTDWFTPDAIKLLCSQEWTVTPQSNRVGIRLSGEIPLARAVTGELASEGTATGAIQVPASGQPVLFLADHPLTGGYPVIATVASHHLDRAGQIPVGARVRFNPITSFDPVEAGA